MTSTNPRTSTRTEVLESRPVNLDGFVEEWPEKGLVAMESDFDPDLSDPARDEYGIARWTPRVLAHYLPRPQQTPPTPPFPPAMSIPAVGRFLCYLSPRLDGVPGDPALLLAAAYRTSASTVVAAGGVPPDLRAHVGRVDEFHQRYRPTR